MSSETSGHRYEKRTIAMVALGYWSAALTNGALRVVLPVYLASVGVSISKIAFLFFLFKFAGSFWFPRSSVFMWKDLSAGCFTLRT